MLILIMLQLFVYCVLALILLVFLLISRKDSECIPYHRGLWIGLLASPLGFVIPYLVSLLFTSTFQGKWPFEGIPIIDPIGQLLGVAFLLLGPCIGPPLVVYLYVLPDETNLVLCSYVVLHEYRLQSYSDDALNIPLSRVCRSAFQFNFTPRGMPKTSR